MLTAGRRRCVVHRDLDEGVVPVSRVFDVCDGFGRCHHQTTLLVGMILCTRYFETSIEAKDPG